MDYQTLQSRTLSRLNMTTTDPIGGLVDEYVNEAIHMIETAAPNGWPWMRQYVNFTTTAGTATYSFGTISSSVSISKILDAKILRQSQYYQPLQLIGIEEADQNYPVTNNGIPEAFYVEGQTFYVYPTPDGAYGVKARVVVTEPDLSFNTATPVLPTVFHSAIVEGALTYFYETLQDSNRLAVAQGRLADWIMRMQRYGIEYQPAPRIRVREWL